MTTGRSLPRPKNNDHVCVACEATVGPLETTDIAGAGEVRHCTDPIACRRGAQARGVWCTYP